MLASWYYVEKASCDSETGIASNLTKTLKQTYNKKVMEVRKYQPDNITPDEFMRPPTEPVDRKLKEIALHLEGNINALAAKVAEKYNKNKPVLKVGTELELLLFSSQFDPAIHRSESNSPDRPNPNYHDSHQDQVAALGEHMQSQQGLAGILQKEEPVDYERLFLELRTKPVDVAGYISQMEKTRDYISAQAHKRGIHPVLHSQHIHLSLCNEPSVSNILWDIPVRSAVQRGILDTYRRAYALLNLPEEVAKPHNPAVNGNTAVKLNGMGTPSDPLRYEGRLNTSEYMFDPFMNLVINLIGVYRGLQLALDPQLLKHPITLDQRSTGPDIFYYFLTTPFRVTPYAEVLSRTVQDPMLNEFLTPDVLKNVVSRMKSYEQITSGERRVSDVRGSQKLLRRLAAS